MTEILQKDTQKSFRSRVQELCKGRGGRPGLPVPNSPYDLCGRKEILNSNSENSELRSCVKVEVAILGSPSLIVLAVSVDVKQHQKKSLFHQRQTRQERTQTFCGTFTTGQLKRPFSASLVPIRTKHAHVNAEVSVKALLSESQSVLFVSRVLLLTKHVKNERRRLCKSLTK